MCEKYKGLAYEQDNNYYYKTKFVVWFVFMSLLIYELVVPKTL